MQSRPDISWSSGVTAVVQWGFSLGQRHPETKRRIMVAGSGATLFDEGPPRRDAIIVPRSEHWIFKAWGNLVRWDKDRRHAVRPASCRCRPIALSFHRLFLGGLLPSRARFRFAGYATWNQEHSLSSISCFRFLCLSRNNSHTERSPLDSAHIADFAGAERLGDPVAAVRKRPMMAVSPQVSQNTAFYNLRHVLFFI
jgi:hypothetical protein